MKIQRLRMGIEVFNKVDGKEYKVVKVDGTTGTAVEMHMDPEGTLAGLGDEEITITEKNALAFRRGRRTLKGRGTGMRTGGVFLC